MYEALPLDYSFQAGEPVQVYVEVHNFASQCVAGPRGPVHEVKLATTLEILDFRRTIVHRQDRTIPDRSLTPRRTFSSTTRWRVPTMPGPPARTRSSVTVRDDKVSASGVAHVARQTLDFKVVSR